MSIVLINVYILVTDEKIYIHYVSGSASYLGFCLFLILTQPAKNSGGQDVTTTG